MENTSVEHMLVASRATILDLLDRRGYETTPYRKLVGPELTKLVNSPDALRMTLTSKTNPEKKAIVQYHFTNIKTQVGTGDYVRTLLDESTKEGEDKLHVVNPKTTEVIVLYMAKGTTEDTKTYDTAALEAWNKYNFKIQFFPIPRLVWNPLTHVLQPKFEIVPPEEHKALLKEWYCQSKTQLPIIRFHNDPVARALGLVPLDIVKITSASPTAGEYVKYRVCAP